MECTWDAALLQCTDELPPELLHIIKSADDERYLQSITQASLDPRYTYTLFAHCEDIFSHVCATLRSHGSLASAISTLGRIVPFEPYLLPYAEQLLATEHYSFRPSNSSGEDLSYLLGLFRLFSFEWWTFKKYIKPDEIMPLLESTSRPIIYLAIRVLQIYLSGADHWFEQMVKRYLGEDTPEDDINGQWDDKVIDYRFLTLWEEERFEKVLNYVDEVRSRNRLPTSSYHRVIPAECFDPSTALVGGIILPRTSSGQQTSSSDQLILSKTVTHNLKSVASALKTSQPLLLKGLPGSGKTSLARHIAQKLGKLDSMVTLHLNEQSDAKMLIGFHTTGETPGSFIWKPGVLTTAVQEGRWILIEDLHRAPTEIIGTLLPLIEKRELLIPNRKQNIYAAQGFRIIATVRSTIDHHGEETNPLTNMLGARHWQRVSIEMPLIDEWLDIATQLFPSLSALLPQLILVYERLQASRQRAVLVGQSITGVLRPITPRDLLKWCSRVTKILPQGKSLTGAGMDDIFMEAVDCFVGALPDCPARTGMAAVIAEELRIDPQRRDYLLGDREVRYEVDKNRIVIGRYKLSRANPTKNPAASQTFSTNPHTTRMLERVAAAATNREPLLLVGETGVGKTAAIQHLAAHLGKKLVPFNLSQQSEAGDLLGGFKPVSARSLIVPMKDEFDELFSSSFSISKNQQFLELLAKQMSKGNWKSVCKIWQQALKMVEQLRKASGSRQGEAPSKKRKVEAKIVDFVRWDAFAAKVSDMEKRLAAGGEAFAFSFVEGSIVKAVRDGDWVLLDEINLASTDTLESIADLFDTSAPSLLLAEAGNVERIDAHPDFRVFAAMNPATDVGKKDLPPGIRSRFTELFVESPDKDIKSLQSIVRSYLRHESAADQAVALDASTLYQKIIELAEKNKLVDGAGQRPHFSLRTLTRTLSFAKYIAPLCSLRRALYEGFQMSFPTLLDAESAGLVQPLLEQHLFGNRTNIRSELQKALRKPNDGHRYLQGYPGSKHWVRQGDFEVEEQPHYILTPFIRSNLENLVRATSTRQFPVLIQGPTSSGKTSMIEYLAKRTGHEFVRINNHEHTDLQEYLGTYISDVDGRLHFEEGILVKALREGHWIVLDELNLAPTDVLEALNRLLDDNRELLVPETQEVVRPHENFMLFATQNPAGLYGGRKTLSRAFRNRFLELHFDDIPIDELQEILHRRTALPESRCKRIVTVYRELSVLRQETRLFEQRSFATLRDLFRWALRPNDTIEQLAANGFMLLAERVRKTEERRTLKDVIEKVMSMNGPKVSIDENALYARDCSEIALYENHNRDEDVVWTKAMRRLYILVSRAIQNNEPVLLVGDTGCGKTTVCQMLALAFGKELYTVNAHQNTETGDLIGSQRPVRNRAVIEANLRHQLLSTWLLRSLDTAAAYSTDALLDAYDRALASLGPPQKNAHCHSAIHVDVQSLRTRFKALFEWSDGALVQAMKTGAFFLLDEISLADDSVLERINSVLEPQRSILLAEKGSLDSYVIAAPDFQFFATMNPGGDYGKRELSPALRNRFTEIWVPSLDIDDVSQIVSAKLIEGAKPYSHSMVAFAQWFKDRYNTSASSSLSTRDALTWVDFVNVSAAVDPASTVVHGAAMVYIDTLGANPAGLMTMSRRNLDQERVSCLHELSRVLDMDANAIYSAPANIELAEDSLIAGPFSVLRTTSAMTTEINTESTFSFQPRTTKINAMRVVKALQLPKPVMLEGSPGVGKTALIIAIAQGVGVPLTRINLSEQTDLIDLFGSDVPVEGEETGTFAWRDAPFLRAMKKGEWVLLDEMNLASQSVLEGLNACLDHRGEVYIPELGQIFSRHPDFRLFAAQNPHHQGGGRKGLPASFVNRFTVVFADTFRSEDLIHICQRGFPQVDPSTIQRAVQFVEQLEHELNQNPRIGTSGRPWEFNLRDLTRWLSLASTDQGLLKSANVRDFVEFLFSQGFRSDSDKAFVRELFLHCFQDSHYTSDLFPSISSQTLQLGIAILPRDLSTAARLRMAPRGQHSGRDPHILQSVMLCVHQKWPVILSGSSGAGKNALIERVAAAVGASVVTITLNADTDVMDLLGGYEQADPQRQSRLLLDRLRLQLESQVKTNLVNQPHSQTSQALSSLEEGDSARMEPAQWDTLTNVPEDIQTTDARAVLSEIQRRSNSVDKARFEWIDGLLVESLKQGKWIVLDNANLCSPSVLDRLNSLLEPDGVLMLNEHGNQDLTPQIIWPHPNFRIFITLDPRYGELSRAMRNRAVELYLPDHATGRTIDCKALTYTESALWRFRQTKALRTTVRQGFEPTDLLRISHDHFGIQDQPLVTRFERQLTTGLYNTERGSSDVSPMTSSWFLANRGEDLKSFYKICTSQLQAPADFANVQTVHPLNNQALLHSSQQPLSEASSLVLAHDAGINFASICDTLASIEADNSLMSKMRRIERSLGLKHSSLNPQSNRSVVVALIRTLTDGLLSSLRSGLSVPDSTLATTRQTLDRIYSFCTVLLDAIKRHVLDPTYLLAFLSVGKTLTHPAAANVPSALSTYTRKIYEALMSANSKTRSNHGRACTVLWRTLKPAAPTTLEQLQNILRFETALDRFDQACRQFELPLQSMTDLRISVSRTIKLAMQYGHGLEDLSEKFEHLLSEPYNTNPSSIQRPHFHEAFQCLHEHYSALMLHGTNTLHQADLARLALLARRGAKDGIDYLSTLSQDSVQRQLQLLGSSVSGIVETETNIGVSVNFGGKLLQQLETARQVSLGQLELFQAEIKTLCTTVVSHSHLLAVDELKPLKACLENLVSKVLRSMSTLSVDEQMQEVAVQLLSSLEMNANDTAMAHTTGALSHLSIAPNSDENRLFARLHEVVIYLRTNSTDDVSAISCAARAWAAFACTCLQLYIAREPFDPALEPRLKRKVLRRHRQDLSHQLEALRHFRNALSGEANCLRARVLEDDLQALGPEPAWEDIYRPKISQMTELQLDLDALMRALQPIWQTQDEPASQFFLDRTLLDNVVRVRTRLVNQYRAYDDFTFPIVGFLDCLLTAQRLAIQATARVQEDPAGTQLATLLPFVGATFDTWLSDHSFISTCSTTLTPAKGVFWLGALSLRSTIWPIGECSADLRSAVQEQFHQYYMGWKAKLEEEQRKAAAKSSLYKFRGGFDEEEPTQEDIDEYFPIGETHPAEERPKIATQHPQELAYSLASLHRSVFIPDGVDQARIVELMHLLSNSTATPPFWAESQDLLPTAIRLIGDVDTALSLGTKKNQNYDIYRSANISEAQKLLSLVKKADRHFRHLHQIWPEHATPLDVLRLCEELLDLSHSAPLSRFLPKVENLHATVNEWQKITSREYRAGEIFEELTSLIVRWRQLELSTWAALFDREWHQCETATASWWYVAYETIIAATREIQSSPEHLRRHAEDFLMTVGDFLTSSGLGEFSARLRMLRGFEAHLAASALDFPQLDILRLALTNFISYYAHFGPVVAEALSRGRAGLEKEVKNVIQLASWKDRKIDVLRQSAQSSHKKLLRLVRKYRALLAEPVAPIVLGEFPRMENHQSSRQANGRAEHNVNNSAVDNRIDLSVWKDRPDRYRNIWSTADLILTKADVVRARLNGAKHLKSFSQELLQSISELQKATPGSLTKENQTFVNHLKTRKRRLLADVLKDLRRMGFRPSMSQQVLNEQIANHFILARLPDLGSRNTTHPSTSAEYEFHRLLSLMPKVRDAAKKASDDLTSAEVGRCTSLLESVLQSSIAQYRSLSSHITKFTEFDQAISQLRNFASCDGCVVSQTRYHDRHIEVAACLQPIIHFCVDTLRVQQNLSGKDYTEVTQLFETKMAELAQLRSDAGSIPQFPPNIQSPRAVTIRGQLAVIAQELQSASQRGISSHPELQPVISQLMKWIRKEDTSIPQPQTNGRGSIDLSGWTTEILATLDIILGSVQDMESTASLDFGKTDSNAWLLEQQQTLDAMFETLNVQTVTRKLFDLLSQLQYLEAEHEAATSSVVAICQILQPILDGYRDAVDKLVVSSSELCTQLNRTGCSLAGSFIQLASRGFCSPSEKSKDASKQEGFLESGTGLGEGEGVEDISKDIGDDEDLSGAANGNQTENEREELKDEKDAVDMADEEMEGDVGGATTASEKDENSEDEDIDKMNDHPEEPGDVDAEGPSAVDEKMWDGRHDQDQIDKEADTGRGQTSSDDVAAAKQAADQGLEDKEETDEAVDDDVGAATEEVERQAPEKLDPHTEHEQNLELPEDLTVNGQQHEDSDESDIESLEDEQLQEPEAADAFPTADDSPLKEGSEHDDDGKAKDDDARAAQDDEVEQSGAIDEDSSDVLMQDRREVTADEAMNDATSPGAGIGPEQGESGDGKQHDTQKSDYDANEDTLGTSNQEQDGQTNAGRNNGDDMDGKFQDPTEDERSFPFKQLADALQQWYDQHRTIQEAGRPNDVQSAPKEDMDMADAHFEHLPNRDAEGDAQALGAASTEQSTALNEENALPANDEANDSKKMFNNLPEDEQNQEDEDILPHENMRRGAEDGLRQMDHSASFIGESRNEYGDVEMTDNLSSPESDRAEDVDKEPEMPREPKSEQLSLEDARELWSLHEESTRNLALVLTEHLRLILHPTQATKLRGDFRTGKRLNIKRIIPYIASSYKRDKIWMRRSVPSKRSYHVMLAIDDSKSMMENRSRDLAFETLALVARSMSMLEVGELSVVGFGETVKVAHDFSAHFTPDVGAETLEQFTFSQNRTNVRKLLAESIKLFRAARLKATGSSSDLWQLQLIISDGICEDHPSIRQLVRQAHEERIMLVFIVVDAAADSSQSLNDLKQSILDLQTAEFVKDASGEMQLKMVKYLDTFPFRYYLIVRDVQELPGVLTGALRQWFAEVVDASG